MSRELTAIAGFERHAFAWVAATGSTNDDLKPVWLEGDGPPRLLVAGHQTRGRGRLGRAWYDEPRRSLLFSFCWEWPLALLEECVLNPALLAGLAVHAAVQRLGASEVTLKWPNDVMSGRRKLAGILVETAPRGESLRGIIGIGINVQPFAAPRSISEGTGGAGRMPVSLHELGMEGLSGPQVLTAVLIAWGALVGRWMDHALLEEARRAGRDFFGIPHALRLPDGTEMRGIPLDLVPPGGKLLFQAESGERLLVTGAHSLERLD
ncbi:MAG: Biotin-protein ligase [Candidatus Ozemobacter sibiricus]|uniref:Biotin-protein ligase n=1 Tax=Candidatus Ozemobacter sibiricus TaxID=2268124 RepID=A0A367ZU08_9BACT|nr:MAG: Biotin-protein ligase [Candidatus Ozemobacter sibiricus]